MDRAQQHQVPEVQRLLDEHRVIVLRGPPRYPRFYGQLERQNRELREWLGDTTARTDTQLIDECEQARRVLNEVVPGRTLGWKTAASVWCERSALSVDRRELAEEVNEEERRIRLTLTDGPWADDKARRLAIESVMARHGWLIRREGGWC